MIHSLTAPLRVLYRLFPFLAWLKHYSSKLFKKDFSAGVTVALVLIPQSMANAQLAGLPAYHGLYAALLPTLIGGLWGSSRQMVTGTVAVTCLMASAALQPLLINSPAGYIAHMALLTLLVGIVQFVLGCLRLGGIVNFLPLPVINGFTNAAAIIIIVSQCNKLLGVNVDQAGHVYQTFLATISSAWNYIHLPSLGMAGTATAILFWCQRKTPKLPAVLLAILFTTFCSWAFDFELTTQAHISDIASDEARVLLARLARQEQELSTINQKIASLEQVHTKDPVSVLETDYAIKELRLVHSHSQQNMKLAREHLRRMLFVAEVKENGRRIFYAKHSPPLVFAKPDKIIPTITTNEENTVRATNGTILPPDELLVRESTLPAEAFSDGKTWRLRLGAKMPNPDALTFVSGGEVVGKITSGLPVFTMPKVSGNSFLSLFPAAFIIAFVGFAESISIGRTTANLRGYRLNANQELMGQGLANIAGGLTLTSPVSGSFSNSAVNLAAGAQTGMACAIASGITLLILFFFTGILQYVPQPVLAVVVIRAAISLLNFRLFKEAWKAQRTDGLIAAITFAATLFWAPHLDNAILLGAVLSLVVFFYRSMNPVISTLSAGADRMLHDAQLFNLEECRHIAIIQFQGPLFFANAAILENTLLDRLETDEELRHIHLVCSGITFMDASGEDTLDRLVQHAYNAKVGISISGVVGSVTDMLARTGLLELIGKENIYHSPREAICAIQEEIQHDAQCKSCPLSTLFCRSSEKWRFSYSKPPNP